MNNQNLLKFDKNSSKKDIGNFNFKPSGSASGFS